MRPLVYSLHSSPAYTIAFVMALIVWIVPERLGLLWLRSSRDPSATRQDRGSFVVLNVCLIAGLAAGFVLAAL